jgi:hypothetical protein
MTFELTDDGQPCPPAPTFADGVSREMKIVNRKGLHARATAKFVQCVEKFDADGVGALGEVDGVALLDHGVSAVVVDHEDVVDVHSGTVVALGEEGPLAGCGHVHYACEEADEPGGEA